MKRWILAARVEPPADVVSARYGGSLIFAAYSRALRCWFHVYPGGESAIVEPQMLFLSEAYARDNPRKSTPISRLRLTSRPSKPKQLSLDL